jgi:hypothetical protein
VGRPGPVRSSADRFLGASLRAAAAVAVEEAVRAVQPVGSFVGSVPQSHCSPDSSTPLPQLLGLGGTTDAPPVPTAPPVPVIPPELVVPPTLVVPAAPVVPPRGLAVSAVELITPPVEPPDPPSAASTLTPGTSGIPASPPPPKPPLPPTAAGASGGLAPPPPPKPPLPPD